MDIKRLPDIIPDSVIKKNWFRSARRLLCDECDVNVDLYQLAKQTLCSACIDKLEDKEKEVVKAPVESKPRRRRRQ